MSVSITVGNIEYPSTTTTVTIVFSQPINDVSINSFITNEPSSAVTLSTLTSSDNGTTWTGTLTGTTGYIVNQAKMTINYTGGITDNTTYDILMTAGAKSWNEQFYITRTNPDTDDTGDVSLTCNKSGTILAVSYHTYGFNAENNIYSHIKVFEKNGNSWVQMGGDIDKQYTRGDFQYATLNDTGDHIIISNVYTQTSKVYRWDGNDWIQKGTTIKFSTQNIAWGAYPNIINENLMCLFTVGGTLQVYEWDTNAMDWVTKGSEIGNGGPSTGRVIFNTDATRLTYYKYDYIYTYTWNSGTTDWELVDTLYEDGLRSTSGVVGNYGGNRIAFSRWGLNTEDKIQVYDWNGSGYVKVGSDIMLNTTNRDSGGSIALDETGNTLITNSKVGNKFHIKIYKYIGGDWSETNSIDNGFSRCCLSADGKTIIASFQRLSHLGYYKTISIYEMSISNKLNSITLTPNKIEFPTTNSVLSYLFSHNDLTQSQVENNTSISDNNLGSLSQFSSSENGFKWSSTFTGAIIDSSGTIDYSFNGMTDSVSLIVDRIEKAISNICFYGDAKVLTNSGYKKIEEIKAGETVNGHKIESVTRTKTKDKEIVLMKKGSIMKNMPMEDVRITKEHKVLYKGNMVKAETLVNGTNIVFEKYNGKTLYNVLLGNEGKMVVNGLIVETLSPTNNIAKLYKILEGYSDEDKIEIIKIFNEEKGKINKKIIIK